MKKLYIVISLFFAVASAQAQVQENCYINSDSDRTSLSQNISFFEELQDALFEENENRDRGKNTDKTDKILAMGTGQYTFVGKCDTSASLLVFQWALRTRDDEVWFIMDERVQPAFVEATRVDANFRGWDIHISVSSDTFKRGDPNTVGQVGMPQSIGFQWGTAFSTYVEPETTIGSPEISAVLHFLQGQLYLSNIRILTE